MDMLTDFEELLSPGEVATLFGVDTKTLRRWSEAGKLPTQWTLGGHRRYPATAVRRLLEQVGR